MADWRDADGKLSPDGAEGSGYTFDLAESLLQAKQAQEVVDRGERLAVGQRSHHVDRVGCGVLVLYCRELLTRLVSFEDERGNIRVEVHAEKHQRGEQGQDGRGRQDLLGMADDESSDLLHAPSLSSAWSATEPRGGFLSCTSSAAGGYSLDA